MAVLQTAADARRAMDVMQDGGITILPNDVGYSLIAARPAALRRIFDTKKRAPAKLNAMLGNDDLHRELHQVSARGRAIVDAITKDYDLPLGLIAPCRADHPLLRALDADTFERSTKGNTLLMLLESPFDEHPGFDDYAAFPPDWASSIEISCSS